MLSKLFCMCLCVLAVFSLHMVTFAEASEEIDTGIISAPIGMGYTDLDGNFVLDAEGELVKLTANFGIKDADVQWEVIDGRDVVSIVKYSSNEAVMTALSNGVASFVAYLDDGTQLSSVRQVIVSNQPEPTKGIVTLSASVEGAGDIRRKTGESSYESLGTTYAVQFAPGTEMELTAVETKYPFKHWTVSRPDSKDVIVCTDTTYKFILGTDMSVSAVFDKTSTFYGTGVEFKGGNVVSLVKYIKSLALSELPSAPYMRNKTFVGWVSEDVNVDAVLGDGKVEKTELSGTTHFVAKYVTDDVDINVDVIGGSGSGVYAYGDTVTVELTQEAQAGKTFLFWSKDGAPASYETTYAFSAVQDCTVSAVFGAPAETDGINMVMQTPVLDGQVLAFTFERYVPEEYTFVTSGFVVSKIENCKRGDAVNNIMESVSFRDGTRTQLTRSMTKVQNVSTYYARGYVIYKAGDAIKTIYSKPQKITIE